VFFEARNRLWLAVFENLEIFPLESRDWLAPIVRHYDIYQNQTSFGFEGGNRLCGRT
jgi:hypothetical protein